jgi:hypothetical protein
MYAWISRLAVPLAAMAMFALAPPVKAESVTYYTIGTFSGNTYAPGGSDVISYTKSSAVTATLTFDGISSGSPEFYEIGSAPAPTFGQFTVTSSILDANEADGAVFQSALQRLLQDQVFTLVIHQTTSDPATAGTGDSDATVVLTSSSFQTSFNSLGSGQYTIDIGITWNPTVIRIPSSGLPAFEYSPDAVQLTGVINADGSISALPKDVTGTIVAAVPLPSVAWAGMAIFGGLSLTKIRRRSKLAQA